MSNKKKEEFKVDITPIESDEANPIKRRFEQNVQIEWSPEELIHEVTQRKKIIEGHEKTAKAELEQADVHRAHVEHIEKMLALPEIKALLDQEDEYLKSTAKKDDGDKQD